MQPDSNKKGVQNISLTKYTPNEIIADTNTVNPMDRHKIIVSGELKMFFIRFNIVIYLYYCFLISTMEISEVVLLIILIGVDEKFL